MNQKLLSQIQAANTALYVEGNFDAIAEFFTPNYIAHFTDHDLPLGHDRIAKAIDSYRQAFSDLQVDVEILVHSQDRVAWQRTLRGTHTGKFKGFPASQRKIVWRDMVTSRFENAQIAEEWIVTDLAERLLMSRKR